jgi:hypothetical protein
MLLPWLDKDFLVLHVTFFFQIPVKKGCLDVQLMTNTMQSSSPSEDGGHRMRERSSSTVSTSSSRVLMVGSNFEVGVMIGGSKLRIGNYYYLFG